MPKGVYPRPTLAERFATKYVVKDDGCWEWIGSRRADGYGKMWTKEGAGDLRAHRVSYELHVGPIPEGTELDHLCRNRACVNPAHLEPVVHRENCLRGASPWAARAAQDRCVRGHEFDEANTRVRLNGTRQCRACDRKLARQRYRERRELWQPEAFATEAS